MSRVVLLDTGPLDKTIDADMILAGQAAVLGDVDLVIATTNVGHLARFAPADLWQNISR